MESAVASPLAECLEGLEGCGEGSKEKEIDETQEIQVPAQEPEVVVSSSEEIPQKNDVSQLPNSGYEPPNSGDLVDFCNSFCPSGLSFLDKLFRMANIAQDGLLSEPELIFFLDLYDYVVSKDEARQIIRQADQDSDHCLNFQEFLSLCREAGAAEILKIGDISKPGQFQFEDSLTTFKIRNLFHSIFHSIGFSPGFQETVEFFENKIAQSGNSTNTPVRKRFTSRPKSFSDGAQTLDDSAQNDLFDVSLGSASQSSLNSEYDFDLIVIGSGAGGLAAATEASRLGKRVAICDMMPPSSIKSLGWRFGPSCLKVGCVPKTLMSYAGHIGEIVDKRSTLPFGWFAPDLADISSEKNSTTRNLFSNDWTTLIDNIQRHILSLNYERQFSLESSSIEYINSHCEFDSSHRLLLTHEDKHIDHISGDKILIAVESLYSHLDIPGAHGNCITVDDIFSLRHYPGKVLIVGGGPDAIECAGLLCSLGIEVTLMSRSPVLKGYDRRLVTLILETLNARGVKIMIGWMPTDILEVSEGARSLRQLAVVCKHIQAGERARKEYNTLVLAIGKRPATLGIKLDRAEVLVDDKTSKIWVDSGDMTTTEDVFAIGDCTSNSGQTVAYQSGVSLAKRLFQFHDELGQNVPALDHSNSTESETLVPKFLMTPVQYACVGLAEEAACFEHGEPNIKVYQRRFQPLQYQLANRYKDTYYAKMITLTSEKERILGLHYLGPNAGEVIQGFVLALKLKATKSDLDSTIGIHPTCAEIFTRMTETKVGGRNVVNEVSFAT